MKAEHRKELHTNLLADRLGKLVDTVKSGPKRTPVVALVGVGLVVVTALVWWIYSGRSAEQRSHLWTQMDAALQDERETRTKLGDLAREHRRTLPGRVARFLLARQDLQEGVRALPADAARKDAIEKLTKARGEFAQLATECADDPVLGPEALMNRARAEEALAGVPNPEAPTKGLGDLDRAFEAYRDLVAKYPNSAEARTAKERLKTYEDTAKRQDLDRFYALLREEFDRKPTPPPGP